MEYKNKRILPVIAAIAIQLCLGTAYIWSIFQSGIANSIFGGDNAAAGLSFSLLLAMLSVGGTIGGRLQVKFGPRVIVISGGLVLALGFFLASFVTASAPWMLWLTYGIMGGIGMGLTYSTTIACAQKWYPDKRGFITGLIVAALGFGGVVFTPAIEFLIKQFGGVGAGEFKTFMVLSVIFLVVCTVGGIFIVNPPSDYVPNGYTPPNDSRANTITSKISKANVSNANYSPDNRKLDYTPGQVLRSPQFYIVTLAMMLACMGGLMMIGFAKPIAIAKDMASTATIGVLIISICNSFGRLFWGWVSDKLGRKITIIVLLSGTAILSLFVNLAISYFIYILIGLIGFLYGGFLSTFPSFTADLFGSKHMATNYGMVLVGFGLGAIVSSYIAGYYKNIAADDINLMFPAFLIASLAALIGILLIAFVKKPNRSI